MRLPGPPGILVDLVAISDKTHNNIRNSCNQARCRGGRTLF
jgi:hypothetical protein